MSNTHTQPCDIEPEMVQGAREYLRRFGITEFFYGITTKVMIPSLHQFKKLRRRIPQEMIKAKCGVYSSEAILRFRHQYLQHFASSDEAYFNKHPMGLSVWADPGLDGAKGEQFGRLLAEYGIRSRGVWHLPVRYHPDWLAAFVYCSDLPREELLTNLREHEAEIGHQLALQILRLTAEGFSSEEVAEQLSLTESGVNYHLDRLKELLNARNRAQLISMAHTLGLID
ncbi:helix-turn-helix transcriptional regulator [Ferrimonas futtsuensis]|uniref:helix-turn-helix transcriptional regulator n=1 Tax=Ferrimonas futtsuensis TaxID=364764 RepID=UPI0004860879|nr:helix-turn-helix transcriptional regulator [Ferrimonas futtsuensis]